MSTTAGRPEALRRPVAVLGAAHPGPAAAVTVLAALLAAADGLPVDRALLVVLAVLTSQLSIGWSNDLLDLDRDRAVGRDDKPLATGAVPAAVVRGCCAAAVLVTVPVGFLSGVAAGAVHVLNTAAGWVYNLGLKGTALSWVPYAVAFGGLPVFVRLADRPSGAGPWWAAAAGALLGVGAHFLNVLPDLADDAATGVRGLPHRIGERWSRVVAVAVLLLATVVLLVGAAPPVPAAVGVAVLVAGLAAVASLGRGRVPFVAAIGMALADVALLVATR